MTFKLFKATLLLSASFLLFTGCGGGGSTDTQQQPTVNTDSNQTTPPQTTETAKLLIGLKSLTLSVDKTTLNKDENTSVKVMASYDDGTTRDLTEKVEWVMNPKDAVTITQQKLTAKKDKATTLTAKLGDVLSNVVNLDITWIVDGHTLPPEPDETLNNSTLFGIDINNNGVRDDVERWIYETYKDKHPIYVDIAMQAGRAYKLVLKTPEKAREIRKIVNAPLFCAWYYQYDAEEFNDPILVSERIDTTVKSKLFNTEARNDIYWEYDKLLSGGVYDLPKTREMKAFCDFNTSKYVK